MRFAGVTAWHRVKCLECVSDFATFSRWHRRINLLAHLPHETVRRVGFGQQLEVAITFAVCQNAVVRAAGEFAVHYDVTAPSADDALASCQSETGAFRRGLRREERLENLRLHFVAHPRPIIGDG